LECRWHDSDDDGRLAVQAQRPADPARIRAQSQLPKTMAENHYWLSAGQVLVRQEKTADKGSRFRRLKEVGSDGSSVDGLRGPVRLELDSVDTIRGSGRRAGR